MPDPVETQSGCDECECVTTVCEGAKGARNRLASIADSVASGGAQVARFSPRRAKFCIHSSRALGESPPSMSGSHRAGSISRGSRGDACRDNEWLRGHGEHGDQRWRARLREGCDLGMREWLRAARPFRVAPRLGVPVQAALYSAWQPSVDGGDSEEGIWPPCLMLGAKDDW